MDNDLVLVASKAVRRMSRIIDGKDDCSMAAIIVFGIMITTYLPLFRWENQLGKEVNFLHR